MALQLIDLGSEIEYVDVRAERVPYSFTTRLAGLTFGFTIKYNERGGFYTVDLRNNRGDVLVFGDPIRYGRALFNSVEDERFPEPAIIPFCLTGEDIDTVTVDNFGTSVRLYLHEREVVSWLSG